MIPKPTLSFLSAAILSFPVAGQAYQVITDEHVDLQVIYASGSLSGKVNPDGRSYDRDHVLLFDGPEDTTTVQRPSGSEWDFLGVGPGQMLHYFPQGATLEGDRIYLGFAADKNTVPMGGFASYFEDDLRVQAAGPWIKITLLDVRFQPAPGESTGPAHFSLWQSYFGGDSTVWMSSFDGGISGDDSVWLQPGWHEHYNWGFSRRGYYQIDFKFSAYLNDGRETYVESAPLTYHFGVEFMPAAIPEPGVLALLLPGTFLFSHRRNRKNTRR